MKVKLTVVFGVPVKVTVLVEPIQTGVKTLAVAVGSGLGVMVILAVKGWVQTNAPTVDTETKVTVIGAFTTLGLYCAVPADAPVDAIVIL